MVAKAEFIISEINQIRAQYINEVGQGRRAWTKAIKARVAELESLGSTPKTVASETGIPYATIVLWRFKRRKAERFKEVGIVPSVEALRPEPKAISKSRSVTLPNLEIPSIGPVGQGLNLRTRSGYLIENLSESGVLKLFASLSAGEY
jgi:hypothetical protein